MPRQKEARQTDREREREREGEEFHAGGKRIRDTVEKEKKPRKQQTHITYRHSMRNSGEEEEEKKKRKKVAFNRKNQRTFVASVTIGNPSGLVPFWRGVVLPGARPLHCQTEKKEKGKKARPPR